MATATKTTARKAASPAPTSEPKTQKTSAKSNGAANSDVFGFNAFNFADTARDQYTEFLKAFNVNAEELSGQTQELMEASRENFETTQARFQEVGSEMMNAAHQEVAEAVDFTNELARAKTMADAFEIQREYATRFFDNRVERTRAVTDAMTDAARETMEAYNKPMATAFGSFASFEKLFPFAAK